MLLLEVGGGSDLLLLEGGILLGTGGAQVSCAGGLEGGEALVEVGVRRSPMRLPPRLIWITSRRTWSTFTSVPFAAFAAALLSIGQITGRLNVALSEACEGRRTDRVAAGASSGGRG